LASNTESLDADAFALSVAPQTLVSVPMTRRQLRATFEAGLEERPLLTPPVTAEPALASTTASAATTPAAGPSASPAEPVTRRSSRRAQAPKASAAPRTAPPRSAPPRGISADSAGSLKRRRTAARFLSMTAMVFIAAIAVATSVPANALLSASDVDALNGAQRQDVVSSAKEGQSVEVSGENVVAGRDGVSVSAAEPVKAYTSSSSNRITPVVPNSTGPILWPFPTQVPFTDGYGPRAGMWTYGGYTGAFHTGLDFDADYGSPIRSIADGIVSEVSANLCGTAVVISHNVNGEKFDSEYCHMISGSPPVSVGQSISAGTIIGNVGSTGMSTGPHLHLEIHVSGNAIDPLGFLQARAQY
jgi:murein DD-endopeptidase MepM/ murein hydrolase activator NlpD